MSSLSWLQFRAKTLVLVCVGPVTFRKLYAFPLSFNSQLIIPLIQHLRINVYQLTVLFSRLGGLLSPQETNENVPTKCELLQRFTVKNKTELEAQKPVGLVFCVFSEFG